uniref:RNA-directed DNA polymerase, eukaryota n=1 Tax=Tanacetum cinerariifolium TaxID=118510 RepID=A0A6L2NX00_TANCI|nr:RNA-directed DNA polymerase, eukaryota [Tanacetum cinerariifolium]
MFALEQDKQISVANKMAANVISGNGSFNVKDIRNTLDDMLLPSWPESTRWVKSIPIKINVLTWRARCDCLPTRSNLIHKGYPEIYAGGGNWTGSNDPLFQNGTNGFRTLEWPSILNVFWKESLVSHGAYIDCTLKKSKQLEEGFIVRLDEYRLHEHPLLKWRFLLPQRNLNNMSACLEKSEELEWGTESEDGFIMLEKNLYDGN